MSPQLANESFQQARACEWVRRLAPYLQRAGAAQPLIVEGRLWRMVGLTLEAAGCRAAVGDRCRILRGGGAPVEAEVVGFSGDRLLMMPIEEVRGLSPQAKVVPVGRSGQVMIGEGLMGRVVDGLGRALDNAGTPGGCEPVERRGSVINPLQRGLIREPLDVGVRAINALLSVGQGQRLGLFAPSGAGKSVLLGMMTRFSNADVIVVGLIGERGREVQEFITTNLDREARTRAVVVACPADDPPLLRVHGALLATRIAEYFRDKGRRVLLLIDSLTRFAHAQREIALAIGEPPATRGFPPSVFARLPQLVERAGNGPPGGGSITAIYTVLTEADEQNDPVGEASRAILDGHIVMSRELAEQGHFPAIDIEASISRSMTEISDADHLQLANEFRRYHAKYSQNQDIINVGAYVPGNDTDLDKAVLLRPRMTAFLQQGIHEPVDFAASRAALAELMMDNPPQ